LLSRRFLHLGKQLYWECNSLKASETFPRGLEPLVWEKVHTLNATLNASGSAALVGGRTDVSRKSRDGGRDGSKTATLVGGRNSKNDGSQGRKPATLVGSSKTHDRKLGEVMAGDDARCAPYGPASRLRDSLISRKHGDGSMTQVKLCTTVERQLEDSSMENGMACVNENEDVGRRALEEDGGKSAGIAKEKAME
jgi:hypothetical protein